MTAPSLTFPNFPPILALCGWSGSGKTWLLERLLPRLEAHGLTALVVKHDAHRLQLDHPGKDTDRLFQAGAPALIAHDPTQVFLRAQAAQAPLPLHSLAAGSDLILLEGHKHAPFPKIWLEHPEKKDLPGEAADIMGTIPWGIEDRVARVERLLLDRLGALHAERDIHGAVLVGGRNSRMGRPKWTLPWQGETLLQHTLSLIEPAVSETVLLGQVAGELAPLAQLPDAPNVQGPMAGLLSAMRWAPERTWLAMPCDLPLMRAEALQWLLAQRRPGAWAILPMLESRPQPLGAIFEPQARTLLERAASSSRFALREALEHPKTLTPSIPDHLAACWTNCNTPEEWRAIQP